MSIFHECVQVLLEFGARMDVFTSGSIEKLTPLMLACPHRFLNIELVSIDHDVSIEAPDRFKRTALIHACMDEIAHAVAH